LPVQADNDKQRVIIGAGALSRLGELAADFGGRKAFLVTDEGVAKAGIVDAALSSLRSASIDCSVFDGVGENPTTYHVEEATAQARQLDEAQITIIGLGGGSAMDCAKGVNFLLSNGGRMEDYRGDGLASKPMLPSIGVPTTAGTGSEAQRFALISDADSHEKMACGDARARFRAVILDAELTRTVPLPTRSAVGMDALSHAIESFVSTAAGPQSRFLSSEAVRLLDVSFQDSLNDAAGTATRARMLLGAHWAGAAIERSMLGVTHACANPLTARYGVVHGVAIGVMLPHVIRFNTETCAADYAQLAQVLDSTKRSSATALLERVERLLQEASMPVSLSDLGVPAGDLPTLASEAASQKTAQFNPRPVTEAEILNLYKMAS
jgi:alcohol dehydrogenase